MTKSLPAVLATMAATAASLLAVGASPALAADTCPNAAIRAQQGSQDLPGCRAYEQVSPVDKNGAPVLRVWPSADGDNVMFFKTSSNADSVGAQLNVQTVARRTASGWALTDATTPPYAPDAGNTFVTTVSTDLSRVLLSSNMQLGSATEQHRRAESDLYTLDLASRQVVPLGVERGVPRPTFESTSDLIGASSSLDTVVFLREGNSPLLPESSTHASGIYRERDGVLRLVSILPDGTVADNGVKGLIDKTATAFFPSLGGGQLRHTVSDDGNRVLFYAHAGGVNEDQLFLRDGDARTLAISESRRTGEAGQYRQATFIGASPSGDVVYFASNDPLTDGVGGGGVYRYRVMAGQQGQLTRLTGDPGPSALGMSSSLTSDDGTSVYFVATAALAAGATAGEPNAYLWRDGQLKLVATVPGGATVARVSRDGRYAVLSTTASIGNANTGSRQQLYLYDSAAGGLPVCASCRPDGSASEGDASLDLKVTDFVQITPPARGITEDGRLYFMSTDRISSADTSSAPDVYVYEKGAPVLLSAGDTTGSYLGENSDDGDTAFIFTAVRLAPQDTDDQFDVYAVRRDGGFLVPTVTECSGEGCQGPVSPPLAPPIAATSTFTGSGNAPLPTPRVVPRVTVSKPRTITGSSATLKVKVSGKGRLTLSGSGVRKATRSVSKAQTVTMNVVLSARARTTLRRKGTLKVAVRLAFTPGTGAATTAKVTLTFKADKSGRAAKGAAR